MNRILTLAIAATAAVLLAPGAAPAAEDPSYPKCTFKVQGSARVSAVTKRGLPVRITCDRPSKMIAALDMKFGSRQDDKWKLIHSGGIPGISRGRPVQVDRTGVARVLLTREAGRFLNRYRRSRVYVHVAAQNPEHPERYKDVADRRLVTFVGRGRG